MSGLLQAVVRPLLVSNALWLWAGLCMAVLHFGVRRGLVPARGAVRALRATVALAFALPWVEALAQRALPVRLQALAIEAGVGTQSRVARAIPELLRAGGSAHPAWWLVAGSFGLVGVALTVWRGVCYARLGAQVRASPLLRRIGRVELRLAEDDLGPASVRLPTRAVVLLPEPVLLSADDRRIALGHELEHHRRGDPIWAVVDALLCALFFWNPALHLLSRLASEWQELACDDALISRRRVSAGDYAACLVRTASRALGLPRSLATVGMAAHRNTTTLRKRVDRMFSHRREQSWALKVVTGLAVLGLGASALAAGTLAQDGQTHGSLSKAAIQKTIHAHLPAVKGCYERELEAYPALKDVQVVVRFVIGTAGEVRSAEAATVLLRGTLPYPSAAESNAPDQVVKAAGDQVSSCLVDQVKGWRFPSPKGGEVTVSYPFQFAPET